MPPQDATPLPQPDASEFRSLLYVPEFPVPEPATDAHRIILWLAADAYPSSRTEGRVVSRTVVDLARFGHDRDTGRALAKSALGDLKSDGLIVDYAIRHLRIDASGMFWGDSRSGEPLSRLITISGLGLQIAGESGRRCSKDTTKHPNTQRYGYRIYEKVVGVLLTRVNPNKSTADESVQNTNTQTVPLFAANVPEQQQIPSGE